MQELLSEVHSGMGEMVEGEQRCPSSCEVKLLCLAGSPNLSRFYCDHCHRKYVIFCNYRKFVECFRETGKVVKGLVKGRVKGFWLIGEGTCILCSSDKKKMLDEKRESNNLKCKCPVFIKIRCKPWVDYVSLYKCDRCGNVKVCVFNDSSIRLWGYISSWDDFIVGPHAAKWIEDNCPKIHSNEYQVCEKCIGRKDEEKKVRNH